jgi:sn-glycerol 3-phosphate transport system ATP-binding protein
MAAITLSAVSKSYAAGARAVEDVSIYIKDGEFIVLVGPSGCGKSTLLRMVAGLEAISDGDVQIAGKRVNDLDPADRDIAMVFQNYALYPHMSVRDNMAYALKNRGVARAEIDARVAEAARMLELGPYLDRKPRALSGGQRQRVAMGRAIVRKPAAFLFDEPLSNLDAKLRVSMRAELRQLQRRLGTTSIYVTHDQLEAMTLADRLVVLNGGRVEQIGAPLEIYHRPASTFVASFIGAPAMNLVDAMCDGSAVQFGGQSFATQGRAAPGPITLGLRAEDLRLARGGEVSVQMRLDLVEELGAQRLVHGTVEGQPLTLVLAPTEPLAEVLDLHIPADRMHVFDTSTGKRITGMDAAVTAAQSAAAWSVL